MNEIIEKKKNLGAEDKPNHKTHFSFTDEYSWKIYIYFLKMV